MMGSDTKYYKTTRKIQKEEDESKQNMQIDAFRSSIHFFKNEKGLCVLGQDMAKLMRYVTTTNTTHLYH